MYSNGRALEDVEASFVAPTNQGIEHIFVVSWWRACLDSWKGGFEGWRICLDAQRTQCRQIAVRAGCSWRFPRVSKGFQGFPKISTDFQGLPKISKFANERCRPWLWASVPVCGLALYVFHGRARKMRKGLLPPFGFVFEEFGLIEPFLMYLFANFRNFRSISSNRNLVSFKRFLATRLLATRISLFPNFRKQFLSGAPRELISERNF